MKLREYQKRNSDKAVELIKNYNIAYLSMEVRTGKTLTALAACEKLQKKEVLFVTKKKAIQSIKNDYENFGFNFDLKLINYESLHKLDYLPDIIIIDEAHGLGAFPKPSLRTKQLKIICKDLPIIYLSGTPTPESHSQIYHQFFISSFSPFIESNFYKWANLYINKKKKYLYNKEINDYSEGIKALIDEKTKHLFISFTQLQAGFDNLINEAVLFVEMKQSTHNLAKLIQRDLVYESEKGVILADTPAKLMQKLHQIYSGTVKTEDSDKIIFDTSKADFIKQYFEGRKIAIYYKFIAEGELLRSIFTNHTDSPEEFNDNDDKVFISQVVSGREGVNLSSADNIVFYNIDFSAVSYWQARDRMSSKTRTKENKVYWIFCKGGIEEKIYKTVQDKKNYTLKYFKNDFGE